LAYNDKNVEILAPAGSFTALKAAVLSGADAVYFGAKALNARRNAANFTHEEIRQAIDFCHLYDVKAYLTLNTLMFDREIQMVIDEILHACKAGFDAIIVQDLGVVSLIKQICPEISIHASTQMGTHNLVDANALYKIGISRVVLARKMSKEEIVNIINHSKIETEIFVHGALCYSLSGQCYFSAFLGERSGNRGFCAQVCRLPFGVKNTNRYNLSLKDLSLIEYVDELKSLGVHSLKIEGRMKSADYVQTTVTQFKNALYHKKYDMQVLKDSFSRDGFTQGYFLSKIDNDMFGIRSQQDIIKSSQASISKADGLSSPRKLKVQMEYYISEKKVTLAIKDCFGHIFISNAPPAQLAITKSLRAEEIVKSLSRLTDTPFFLININGYVQENCYFPLSALNELRRTAVEGLIKRRQYRKPYICHMPNIPDINKHEKTLVKPAFTASFKEVSQISEEILEKVQYASLDLFKFSELDEHLLNSYHDKLVAELPRVYFEDEQLLKKQLIKLRQYGIHYAKAHSIGRLQLAKKLGYDVMSGFGLNIANSLSAQMLSNLKPVYITLSVELTIKQINQLKTSSKIAMLAYGHFPLMSTRVCPIKYEIGCAACQKKYPCMLTDRKGMKFAVLCSHGISEILNCVPIYLADKLDDVKTINYMELFFTTENKETCYKILTDYEKIRSPNQPYTRGIYYRKLL
jgi:putative protease